MGIIIVPSGAGVSTGSAAALKDTTGQVDVSASSAPSTGNILVATDSTHATWQAPATATTTNAVQSATTTVNTSSATAPSTGQILTATDSTHATWQAIGPASGVRSASTNVDTSAATAPGPGQILVATSSTAMTWQDGVIDQGWAPEIHGFKAWTWDPSLTLGNSPTAASNNLWLVRVNIWKSFTVSNIIWLQTANASGGTTNENFMGVYSSAGSLLGTTADLTSTLASGGAGTKRTFAITSPFAVTSNGSATSPTFVWVAYYFQATTLAQSIRTGTNSAVAINLGLTSATSRAGVISQSAGLTALPSSITPSSIDQTTNSNYYWAALT